MPKLPDGKEFIDLSDYGRPVAKVIVNILKSTRFTSVDVTISFIISGFIAIYCILVGYYWSAAFFLVLKSILDAADGELARVKNMPSYVGRYLDSVADISLNLLILLAVWYVTDGSLLFTLIAFICVQLQGTLYNYYYVILRNLEEGDTTSRVHENKAPKAFPGEKQSHVNVLFALYNFCYKSFDDAIYQIDKGAKTSSQFPNWLMTAVSTFGLGFQLLSIGIMLVAGWDQYIIPFFIGFSVMIPVFILLRKSAQRAS